MLTLLLASCAAAGTYLLLQPERPGRASTTGWRTFRRTVVLRLDRWLAGSGLGAVSVRQFLGLSVGVGALATVVCWLVLGVGLPSLFVGIAASGLPTALWRRRATEVRNATMEAWPRMIEEIRVRVGSTGQPIPQALIETGIAGPEAMRGSFLAARRQWTLTTDFPATVSVLKESLADPTADAVCETLLVVHEVGGELDARLEALATDRRADLRHRREADARSAGARLARWFVIIVPAGMAFAGLNLGEGRRAYGTPAAQVATVVAIAMVAACWWWAGRIMSTPAQARVFDK